VIVLRFSFKKFVFVLLVSVLFSAAFFPLTFADQKSAKDAISAAKSSLLVCYSAAKQTEAAGVDVAPLVNTLNQANRLLMDAESAYSYNDVTRAYDLAVQSENQLVNFTAQTNAAKDAAGAGRTQNLLVTGFSLVGSFVVVGVGVFLWIYLTKRNGANRNLLPHRSRFRISLVVCTVAVALFVASPGIQQMLVFPQSSFFSELALLGPQHTASAYPSDIAVNQTYNVYLDVTNHLGHQAYYMVQVKLLNQTQFEASASVPSFDNVTFFAADKQTWDVPITFSFDYIPNENLTQVNMHQITFNSNPYDAQGNTFAWDTQRNGSFGYLVFELWLYNGATGSFENNGRSVDLVLNMKF
jgi:hypothetical protein